MPSRRLPNTIPAVIRTLKTARDTWKNTPVAADRAISDEHWAKLDDAVPASLLNRFLKEAGEVDLAQAAQAPLTTALAQTAERLTMFVSHFHQVLDLGIVRGDFAPGARSYYGRDVGATSIPDLSSYDAVAEAAEKIVTGEAARAAAETTTWDGGMTWDQSQWDGTYRPMALPSAAEVGELLTAFNTQRGQSQTAQSKTDREREEAMALYPEAQALAVDICDTVEFFYRKDPDASSRRAKCERWGVAYLYESAPAPTPPPAGGSTPPTPNP